MASDKPIVLYDGDCGFCNSSVQFVLNHEHCPAVNFAALQGETGQRLLEVSPLPSDIGFRSIVFYDGNQFLVRSRAAFAIMAAMGGQWSTFAKILKLIPRPIADIGYRFIASIRKYLPSKGSCALLPPEQRKRFLP